MEDGGRACAELHAGCARQPVAENLDDLPRLSGGTQERDKWVQAHVQAKERTLTVRAAEGSSVQDPVRVLNQRNGWRCACRVVKVIENSEATCRLDPVNGPKLIASARRSGAVEIAVGRLQQSGKGATSIGSY